MGLILKAAPRILIAIAAGLAGLVVGGFLGLAVASFVTGRGGLHGFDASALVLLIGGGLVGIVAGTKLGNSIAKRLR